MQIKVQKNCHLISSLHWFFSMSKILHVVSTLSCFHLLSKASFLFYTKIFVLPDIIKLFTKLTIFNYTFTNSFSWFKMENAYHWLYPNVLTSFCIIRWYSLAFFTLILVKNYLDKLCLNFHIKIWNQTQYWNFFSNLINVFLHLLIFMLLILICAFFLTTHDFIECYNWLECINVQNFN